MQTTDMEIGATTLRPKTLTASSLIQRAVIGMVILTGFIIVSALLYDAVNTANAKTAAQQLQHASSPLK